MVLSVYGFSKEGFPISTNIFIRHFDEFYNFSYSDYLFLFLTEVKKACEDFERFAIFNDGYLCAFLNEDQVLWFSEDRLLCPENDDLEYGHFYMLCISFDKFIVEED